MSGRNEIWRWEGGHFSRKENLHITFEKFRTSGSCLRVPQEVTKYFALNPPKYRPTKCEVLFHPPNARGVRLRCASRERVGIGRRGFLCCSPAILAAGGRAWIGCE